MLMMKLWNDMNERKRVALTFLLKNQSDIDNIMEILSRSGVLIGTRQKDDDSTSIQVTYSETYLLETDIPAINMYRGRPRNKVTPEQIADARDRKQLQISQIASLYGISARTVYRRLQEAENNKKHRA